METHLLALMDQARIIYSLECSRVCQAFLDSGALKLMIVAMALILDTLHPLQVEYYLPSDHFKDD